MAAHRRSGVLEFAVLGLLQDAPMHGYELRKRLNAVLGTFRAISYGSLYPALKDLLERGLIAEAGNADASAPVLSGRRAKIVYELTAEGKDRFAELVSRTGPESWEDEAFGVHMAFFGSTPAEVRVRILEGRRSRMEERLSNLHASMARNRERIDTYTLALRLTGDPHEAADVTQEAYLRAYRSIGGFRSESRFSTWMYRITANCASTHMGRLRRHRRRNRELALDEMVVDETGSHDPQARTDAAELQQQLLEALDSLPAKLRAVVVLRDSYDMSHEDIAEQLGISVTAAKVRLHRARRRIHESVFADDGSLESADG